MFFLSKRKHICLQCLMCFLQTRFERRVISFVHKRRNAMSKWTDEQKRAKCFYQKNVNFIIILFNVTESTKCQNTYIIMYVIFRLHNCQVLSCGISWRKSVQVRTLLDAIGVYSTWTHALFLFHERGSVDIQIHCIHYSVWILHDTIMSLASTCFKLTILVNVNW